MSEIATELLERVQPMLASHDTPVYLVGGAVRDAFLDRPAYDLDFVLERGAIDLAFAIADELRVAAYVLDDERDIGRVVVAPGVVLDFARFRGPHLEADLRARDFTINAMAIDARLNPRVQAGAIIDPAGGLEDLRAGIVRLTYARAMEDDPLRTLRAVRLARQLDFQLAPETGEAARRAAPRLAEMSSERVRDELLKIIQGPGPHDALRQMADLELLSVTLPEIEALRDVQQSAPHHEPVLGHTVNVLQRLLQVEGTVAIDEAPDDAPVTELYELLLPHAPALRNHLSRPIDGLLDGRAALRLGALYHDVGKAITRSIEEDGRIRFLGHDKEGAALAASRLRALRLSNDAVTHIRAIVAGHMRPLHLTQAFLQRDRLSRRAVYRYFRDTGDAAIDIVLLSLADHLATYNGAGPEQQWQALQNVIRRLLVHYFERYEESVSPNPVLDGSQLITAFDLKPGPQIGRLLRLIKEAQAVGEVTTKEEALTFAREKLEIKD